MIKGQEKEKLTENAILNKVDDFSIYTHYLGKPINFKKKFQSPFRQGKDDTPNLTFFTGASGRIMFKDFANGLGGDCFTFIKELFNISFFEALKKIDSDLNLGIYDGKRNPKFKINIIERPEDLIRKHDKIIQFIPREEFTLSEFYYWKDYQISLDELKSFNVFPVEKLYINKRLIPNYNKELRFAYLFDEYVKIYSPHSFEYKWISSVPNDFISGFDNIKYKIFTGKQDDKLIISKSLKDEIVLSKFFKDVCSTQNESSASINEENMNHILKGYKPENVYIAYDSDEPGVKASKYYSEKYNFKWINVPTVFMRESIKDFADLVKHKGLNTLENYLNIKKLFR